MSFAPLTLEQFAEAVPLGGGHGGMGPVDPQEAYLEGVAAGEAAALARLSEAERAFLDAAQSLDSALHGLKPASERALAEAIETILAALLPTLTERGFATEAAGAISRAFAGNSRAQVTIAANPAQAEALTSALSAAPGAPAFIIEANEAVAVAAARIQCGKGGLDFDLDAAVNACLAALAAALGRVNNGT